MVDKSDKVKYDDGIAEILTTLWHGGNTKVNMINYRICQSFILRELVEPENGKH